MYIGSIHDPEEQSVIHQPVLVEAINYLKNTDFSKMEPGSYPIGDKGVVAKLQRYESRTLDKCRPETHEKFIDIQFIYEGEESMGWCPVSPDLEVTEAYDPDRDVAFYKSLVPESSIILTKGYFAVLYPIDVHRPCASVDEAHPSKVTKVVIKVPLALLK